MRRVKLVQWAFRLILAVNIMDLVVQDLGALALLCFYGSVGEIKEGHRRYRKI